ncbi:hypothetical protein LMG7974_01927 [Campylobacter majalis]|uniref:DUF637 domain-containing protein n=3 Tax=Campylobacter TaxID=194 RepID=A0ABM8QA28_9BACT|nr:hypothetical protein LMG7974_01927 [Campylobacter majalis]
MVSAMSSAVIANSSLQLTNMVLSNGKVKFDTTSLTKSAISAGVGAYVSSYINNLDILKDATLANDNSSFLNFSTDNSLNFSYQNFTKAALNSISNAGINSAIYGTNFKDNLISNLAIQTGDSLYKSVGDIGLVKNLDDKSLTKIALHSLVGGSISAIQNQSFKDGAIISGLAQALAPLSSNTDTNKQFLSSQLIGILTGAILSGETGANQGYNLSTSAEQNNRQLHKEEIGFINNQKNIDKFKEILKTNGLNVEYSNDEIKSILAKGGVSLVDKSFNEVYENNLPEKDKNNIGLAINFIKDSNFYNERLNNTNAFNPTKEQYSDKYIYLDTFKNDRKFYENNLKLDVSIGDTTLGFISGVSVGGVNLIKDTINGAYELITSPIDTSKNIYNTLTNANTLITNGFYKNELDLILGDYKSATARDFEFIAGLTGGITIGRSAAKSNVISSTNDVIKGADSAVNVASYEKYKKDLISKMGKVQVKDVKLQKIINTMYREGAKIGSGSTADAVRYELKTGQKVGNKLHIQKAIDNINALNKWLKNNPRANKSDIDTAQKYIKDLTNAINGN